MSELVTVDPARVDVGYWTDSIVFAARVAEKVADTEFVPAVLRGRPDAVAATILYGLEVGLTPMQALQGIHIVEGRPAPSAEMMRALVFRAGHSITVHDATGTRVRLSGLRRGRPESERVVVEWTIDMARAAGLLGRRNWQNYPRAMLMARASGDLARILFPDVVKGLGYVAEDADVDDATFHPVEVAPPSRRGAIQRRRATPKERRTEDTDPPPAAAQNADDGRPPPVAPPPERTPVVGETGSVPVPSAPDNDDVPLPLPDELQPEPSAPEPVAEDAPEPARLVAAGPLKAIQSGMTRHLGTAATREERLTLISAIVQRDVTSSKDLTRAEGYRVLDYLDRFDNGAASFVMDPDTGQIAVHDLRTEDDPSDD